MLSTYLAKYCSMKLKKIIFELQNQNKSFFELREFMYENP